MISDFRCFWLICPNDGNMTAFKISAKQKKAGMDTKVRTIIGNLNAFEWMSKK